MRRRTHQDFLSKMREELAARGYGDKPTGTCARCGATTPDCRKWQVCWQCMDALSVEYNCGRIDHHRTLPGTWLGGADRG